MLKIKKMKFEAAVCPVFKGWGGNLDEIEHIEDRFEKIGIRWDFGQVNVYACEKLSIGFDRLRGQGVVETALRKSVRPIAYGNIQPAGY